jgi:hypothetical protein
MPTVISFGCRFGDGNAHMRRPVEDDRGPAVGAPGGLSWPSYSGSVLIAGVAISLSSGLSVTSGNEAVPAGGVESLVEQSQSASTTRSHTRVPARASFPSRSIRLRLPFDVALMSCQREPLPAGLVKDVRRRCSPRSTSSAAPMACSP